MTRRFLMIYAGLTLWVVGLGSTALADNVGLKPFDGQWVSIACEVRPQQTGEGLGEWWLTRDIMMKAGRIDAVFTTYAGPGCDVALQTLHFGGKAAYSGQSNVIEGAAEVDLVIDDYVQFTPLTQGFADFLNSAPVGTCGSKAWSVGVTQDVLETGCSFIGLQPNRPTREYEVLAIFKDQLFFAARPTDGSFITTPDNRPKALQVPLVRK